VDHDHFGFDGGGGFVQAVSVFQVLDGKFFPFSIPGDRFVDDAKSSFGATRKKGKPQE
jgi:hypothetical protein